MKASELKNLITDIVGFVTASHERYFSLPFPTTISASKIKSALEHEEMLSIPLQAVGDWIPFREFQITFTKGTEDNKEYYNVKLDVYNEENEELILLKSAEREFYLADYTKENQ